MTAKGYGSLISILGLVNNSNYENTLQSKIFDVLEMYRSPPYFIEEKLDNYSLAFHTYLHNVPYYLIMIFPKERDLLNQH